MKIKNLFGKPLKINKARTQKQREENKPKDFTLIAKGEGEYKLSLNDPETKLRLEALKDAGMISYGEVKKDVREPEKATEQTGENTDRDTSKGSVSKPKKNKGK